MLEKNLEVLERKNPSLAKRIREHKFKDVQPHQAQSGDYNLSYRNVLLHNQDNPILETNTLFSQASDLETNDIYVVYGLGLGYLFKKMYIFMKCKIILFEPFLDVLTFTLSYVDLSEEFENNRVFVCNTFEDMTQVLNDKYLVGDKLDVTFLPSYLQIDSKILQELSNLVISLIESKKMDQGTILKMAELWGQKSLSNIDAMKKAYPVDVLKDAFKNQPILLVCAGPSLEENLELIKKNRKKYIVVTINTALRALIKNDIIPDFCVISEIWHIDVQLENLPHLDQIRYIFMPRTQDFCWNLSKHKNFYYLTSVDGFSNWYNKLIDNKCMLRESAGSVAIIAFYISTQVFGSRKIILVGQDLAFVNDKVYSASAMKEEENIEIKDNAMVYRARCDLDNTYVNHHFDLVEIKNYAGEKLKTRKDYYQYIKQYETIIENEIPKNVHIINTSVNGAFIKGMLYEPLQKTISLLEPIEKPIDYIVENRIKQNKGEIERVVSNLDRKLQRISNDSQRYLKLCTDIILLNQELASRYKTKEPEDTLLKSFNSYVDKKNDLINFIKSQEILFYMLQEPLLTYSKKYIKASKGVSLKSKDQIENLMTEMVLLKAIDKSLVYFIENITVKLHSNF